MGGGVDMLDFQIDKSGYVAVKLAGNDAGYLVYNNNKQVLFSSNHKTQFRLVSKEQYPVVAANGAAASANSSEPTQPELEYGEDNYLVPIIYPVYYSWPFWYRFLPLIIFIVFLLLCIAVWKVGYKHGQQWFLINATNSGWQGYG